jgi:hypothetical protein
MFCVTCSLKIGISINESKFIFFVLQSIVEIYFDIFF